jgi:hypothetical protein
MIINSVESRRNLVEGLYQAFLGRPADSDGLSFWATYSPQGSWREQVVTGLVGSAEFLGLV